MKGGFAFALKNYRAAFIAAFFFGCIAPGTKLLVHNLPPQSTAGILYFFAGIGMLAILLAKKELLPSLAHIKPKDGKWLFAATLFGGILGPAFLTYGLLSIRGSTASLLLNLESVLTSLIAWFVFKEHFEKKIVWGMLFIISGCVILSWSAQASGGQDSLTGVSLIALACLSWGIDNNVTRNIAHLNPVLTASIKGVIAGSSNLALGFLIGERFGLNIQILQAGLLGFLGIGVSLVAFIISLGTIGTARTGAVFSTAPFVGAILSVLVLGEAVSIPFILALVLMGFGVMCHLSEEHLHEHSHPALEHSHEHAHDEHHQHAHDADDPPGTTHNHKHRHVAETHQHRHFPDIHHLHEHEQ
ncbi:MAG: hypothetical protein A2X94_10310 [Bdellovibrionales bacterium GWB1_55_8]|nr:MAG: hypothetical protein A2X94_10310 [Bdellovibrionales bacterium GWB1_55_8]